MRSRKRNEFDLEKFNIHEIDRFRWRQYPEFELIPEYSEFTKRLLKHHYTLEVDIRIQESMLEPTHWLFTRRLAECLHTTIHQVLKHGYTPEQFEQHKQDLRDYYNDKTNGSFYERYGHSVRKWQEKNKEKLQAYRKEYYKEYWKTHKKPTPTAEQKERTKERMKKYYQKNREQRIEYQKEYNKNQKQNNDRND